MSPNVLLSVYTQLQLRSYFIVCFYRLQCHQELEAEQIVGSKGLQFQQFAKGNQLRSI